MLRESTLYDSIAVVRDTVPLQSVANSIHNLLAKVS